MADSCRTRAPRGSAAPSIARDPDAIDAHLEDAAHYPGGHAAGVAMPRTEADVAELVRGNARVLAIGAQSSLTGGATPFGDVVIGTARMSAIGGVSAGRVTAQAGATLTAIAEALAPHGAAFPPAPTFMGATIGGAVATNAAGAATFKYGSVRAWVEGLTVVLASGDVLDLRRGQCLAHDGWLAIETAAGTLRVPVPTYEMPDVAKRSAGYHSGSALDAVDLFIGCEGTLGIVTEVTLRTVQPAPAVAMALVFCPSEAGALAVVGELRAASRETWRTGDASGIDVSAIEYVDDRSLRLIASHPATGHRSVRIPDNARAALLVQLDLAPGTTTERAWEQIWSYDRGAVDTPLAQFVALLDRHDLLDSSTIAGPGEREQIERFVKFRESVPTRVNELVGAAKRGVDARIEKTAADMVVPFERFAEMLAIYRDGFERRGLDFAIWGHVSDGNVHPNVIPRSYEDVVKGKEAILEFGREVARLGGCPLAEHGVGRNLVKQALLAQLYGEAGIEQMRATKRALDPEWKLAPGVIFAR